jgi:hypothetical protein
MRIDFKCYIYDENDEEELMNKVFDSFYFEYSEFEPDENKIFKYNFVERKQWEPIVVKKGQHFHLIHAYYHPSTSERFWYGQEGENFAEAENMDRGVFAIK